MEYIDFIVCSPFQSFGSWLKDDEELPSFNGTVVHDETSLNDAGWYQCYVIYNSEEYSSISYFLSVKERRRRRKKKEKVKKVSDKVSAALSSSGEETSKEAHSRYVEALQESWHLNGPGLNGLEGTSSLDCCSSEPGLNRGKGPSTRVQSAFSICMQTR
jgi:hypothetical protein